MASFYTIMVHWGATARVAEGYAVQDVFVEEASRLAGSGCGSFSDMPTLE